MKRIVVIGGIGSGKSTVSRTFVDQGAAYIDLDVVGHEVLTYQETIDAMVEAFGSDIVGDDGQIDRRALAAKAFASPGATATLNGISHPRIIAKAFSMLASYGAEGAPAAVVEISPYDGPDGTFGVFTEDADAVVAVVAPVDTRVARAVAKGFKEEDVRNRIAAQVSDEQRESWATHVIRNDSTLEALQAQIDACYRDVVEG